MSARLQTTWTLVRPHARPRLPVIELHDGKELLTRAPFQAGADATYADAPDASAILVFVGVPRGADRDAEYSFGPGTRGDAYVTFLKDELRSLEAQRLRVCSAAAEEPKADAEEMERIALEGLLRSYDTRTVTFSMLSDARKHLSH